MAIRTVSATSAGSSAKPFSRSAEMGTSTARAIVRACARASSRVTDPSSRASVAAKPLLVVASALKPAAASSVAEPASHGFGSRSGRSPSCSERKAAARSACELIRERARRGSLRRLSELERAQLALAGFLRRALERRALDEAGFERVLAPRVAFALREAAARLVVRFGEAVLVPARAAPRARRGPDWLAEVARDAAELPGLVLDRGGRVRSFCSRSRSRRSVLLIFVRSRVASRRRLAMSLRRSSAPLPRLPPSALSSFWAASSDL